MLTVDRHNFIAWTQGILLDRVGNKVLVGDNEAHEKAMDALDAGDPIGLTVGGEIVSTMRLVDDEYVEEAK